MSTGTCDGDAGQRVRDGQLSQFVLALLQFGNIDSNTDDAAVPGLAFLDPNPAPIDQLQFERARRIGVCRQAALDPGGLIADGISVLSARDAAADDVFEPGAFDNKICAQGIEGTILFVEDRQPVVGVVVGESVRDRLDGVVQALLGHGKIVGDLGLCCHVDNERNESDRLSIGGQMRHVRQFDDARLAIRVGHGFAGPNRLALHGAGHQGGNEAAALAPEQFLRPLADDLRFRPGVPARGRGIDEPEHAVGIQIGDQFRQCIRDQLQQLLALAQLGGVALAGRDIPDNAEIPHGLVLDITQWRADRLADELATFLGLVVDVVRLELFLRRLAEPRPALLLIVFLAGIEHRGRLTENLLAPVAEQLEKGRVRHVDASIRMRDGDRVGKTPENALEKTGFFSLCIEFALQAVVFLKQAGNNIIALMRGFLGNTLKLDSGHRMKSTHYKAWKQSGRHERTPCQTPDGKVHTLIDAVMCTSAQFRNLAATGKISLAMPVHEYEPSRMNARDPAALTLDLDLAHEPVAGLPARQGCRMM